MSRRDFRLLSSLVLCASLLLRYLVQPAPLYGAQHDDELMVRLASSILKGNWLGNYTDLGHLTLSKPAGYPLFLAWTHFLPWAPTVTVHLLLLTGIVLIARELRSLGIGRGAILIFVALSALHPQWFGWQMSRIYRDGFLAALTFVGIGLSLQLGRLLAERKTLRDEKSGSIFHLLLVASLNGFVLSWMIATKPGWYPLAVVMVLFTMRRLLHWRNWNWRLWFTRITSVGTAVLFGLASVVGYISFQNKSHYDIFQLDTFSTGTFPKALSKWSSVQSDDSRKYISVDASQRGRVYEVSEIARKLKPYLELGWGNGWRGASCSSGLQICDESSAWFAWDLRDAMRSASLDNSAKQFELSFAQLEKEISLGCRSKKLNCSGSSLAPGVVSLSEISKREFVDAYSTAFDWIVFSDIGSTVRGGVSTHNPEQLAVWDSTVKGLPSRVALNVYRPEVTALGNSVLLVQRLFNVIWPLIFILSSFSLIALRNVIRQGREIRIISLISFGGALLFVFQLALLEASSGMYLTIGKQLYLLPVFPFVLLFISTESSRMFFVISERVKNLHK